MSRSIALGALDLVERVADQRQRAQPEEVHLQEADPLDLLHRPLRDDFVLLALVERHELGQRPRRDDDAGGVDRGVAGHAFEPPGDGEQLLDPLVLLLHLLERRALARAPSSSVMSSAGGIALATRSASAYGMSITRPTSRTTARAFIVPNVMICATFSRPYFRVTYSMTSPRRRSQKSMSMSGSDTRSGLRKRSKIRSYSIGSTSVIRRQ